MHVCVPNCFSCVWLFVTLWTAACQNPLSMGFFRQENWSGLPCPPPGDLPDPGIEPVSLMSPALAGRFLTTSTNSEALYMYTYLYMCMPLVLFPWRTQSDKGFIELGFGNWQSLASLTHLSLAFTQASLTRWELQDSSLIRPVSWIRHTL